MGKHLKRKTSSRNEDSDDKSPITKCRRLENYEGGCQGNDIGHTSRLSSYMKSSKPRKGNKQQNVGNFSGTSGSASSSSDQSVLNNCTLDIEAISSGYHQGENSGATDHDYLVEEDVLVSSQEYFHSDTTIQLAMPVTTAVVTDETRESLTEIGRQPAVTTNHVVTIQDEESHLDDVRDQDHSYLLLEGEHSSVPTSSSNWNTPENNDSVGVPRDRSRSNDGRSSRRSLSRSEMSCTRRRRLRRSLRRRRQSLEERRKVQGGENNGHRDEREAEEQEEEDSYFENPHEDGLPQQGNTYLLLDEEHSSVLTSSSNGNTPTNKNYVGERDRSRSDDGRRSGRSSNRSEGSLRGRRRRLWRSLRRRRRSLQERSEVEEWENNDLYLNEVAEEGPEEEEHLEELQMSNDEEEQSDQYNVVETADNVVETADVVETEDNVVETAEDEVEEEDSHSVQEVHTSNGNTEENDEGANEGHQVEVRAEEEGESDEHQLDERVQGEGGDLDDWMEGGAALDEEEERRIEEEFNAFIGYTGEDDNNNNDNIAITEEQLRETVTTLIQMAEEIGNLFQEVIELEQVGLTQEELDRIKLRKFGDVDTDLQSSSRCSICLNELQNDDVIRILSPCSHQFHQTCIDQWLKANRTCPLCRTTITPQ